MDSNTKLRIALILERYEPLRGGLESWTCGLAQWLAQRGHYITIVTTSGTSNEPGIVVKLVADSSSPLIRAAALNARLANLQVDIAHDMGACDGADIFQPQTGSRAVNAEFEFRARPWREQVYGWRAGRLNRWRREVAKLERRQFARPARIIAVSQMVRQQIAQAYGVDAQKMTVIHNGVDTKKFDPVLLAEKRPYGRTELGLKDELVYLLVANNFHLKAVAVAIRAMALLISFRLGVKLIVAGKDDATKYKVLAKELGVEDNVAFLGHISQMEDVYAVADIAIQPTYYDACSLATAEGLSCGLPTITTKCNGASELIRENENGLVLPRAGDAFALANAMKQMWDEVLREKMALTARRLALQNDVGMNYEKIEAYYHTYLSTYGSRLNKLLN